MQLFEEFLAVKKPKTQKKPAEVPPKKEQAAEIKAEVKKDANEGLACGIFGNQEGISEYAKHIVMGEILNSPRFKNGRR